MEETISNLGKSYVEALKTVNMLKDRINEIEQARSVENSVESPILRRELDTAIDGLDAFVDSWILKSQECWKKYRLLEKEFTAMKESDLDKLNALRNLCEQSEQLAKDLLCYSLAHLRRGKS